MNAFIPFVTFFIILQFNCHQAFADLVSYGKTVEASPVPIPCVFPPENALDGNDVPYLGLGGCFLTDFGVNHWLKVDLGQQYDITKVVIITAIDNIRTQYALQEAQVVVGNVGIADFGTIISDNSQCGNTITFEQLNTTSSLLDILCSPPISGSYVFVTSIDQGDISLCEIFVYSRTEDETDDYLPLDPTGFWPLNSIYTIHDLSGFRNPHTSSSKVHFNNDSSTSIGFADLVPVEGGTSILIPTNGKIGVGKNFTLLFDIKPEPSSHGLVLRVGGITVSQINSGNRVYASEILITVNNTSENMSSVVFIPDIWTSIAIAYNGSTLSLWRNGYFVKAKDFSMPPIPATGNLEIGFDVGARGSIRNIHTYSRILSQREIMATFTIPSKENIPLRTAESMISNLYSAKSNLFKLVKSAKFASEHVTADGIFVKTNLNCALLCFREMLCNGYAFNKGSNQCVIGLGFVDEAELVANQDWYFYIYLPKW